MDNIRIHLFYSFKKRLLSIKMTHEPFSSKSFLSISFSLPSMTLFFYPTSASSLFSPLSHLTHYSIACVKRVIAQIIQRQLSVFDTGEHNHHHKQPLMALSGSSKNAPQLGLAQHSAAGPNAVGTNSAAARAKFYPNEFGPCQVIAKGSHGHPIPS